MTKGQKVWAHFGQLHTREPAVYIEKTEDGHLCQIEDGRTINFTYARMRR